MRFALFGLALAAIVFVATGGHMLFLRNKDKPGFVGNLGRTLGEAAVNIATLHLGRTAPGELLLMDMGVEGPAL